MFECLLKLGLFQLAKFSDPIRTNLFKNGGICIRALRCHQGSYWSTNLQMGVLDASHTLHAS